MKDTLRPRADMPVSILSFENVGEIVTVLHDAFYDYPVMRYVLGAAEPYDHSLRRAVELFVNGRAYRNEPMLGVRDGGGILVAAAVLSLPRSPEPPASFLALRESTWAELGADARNRYQAFAAATEKFAPAAPHYHLTMIGVRRSHQGLGLARVLLDRIHELSSADGESSGVSLTTESPENVPLYQHFGYRVVGHAVVAKELETWTLFRPRQSLATVIR